MILAKEEWAKKLNSAVFPGQQGGPLMHAIAAKAVAMKIAGTEEFKERQQRTLMVLGFWPNVSPLRIARQPVWMF